MAQNLLKAGYKVVVWNRTAEKCKPLVEAGATLASSPAEVARSADVTFGMLADPFAAYMVACQLPDSIASGLSPGKGYVDVSTVDGITAMRVADGIREKGAQYLEAPVSGSKGPAEKGELIFLGAGDEELYSRIKHPLEVMGKASLYLGEEGAGANMKLVVNMVMGSMMASFAEGINLAEKSGLSAKDFLKVVSLGAISSPMFSLKGSAMVERDFPTAFPLKHQEKDLRLALELAEEMGANAAVADAAYMQYRDSVDMGLGDQDFSAVLEAVSLEMDDLYTNPEFRMIRSVEENDS